MGGLLSKFRSKGERTELESTQQTPEGTLSRQHQSEPELLDVPHEATYSSDTLRSTKSEGGYLRTKKAKKTSKHGSRSGSKSTLEDSREEIQSELETSTRSATLKTEKGGTASKSSTLDRSSKSGTLSKGGTLKGLFKSKSSTLKSTKSSGSKDSLSRRHREHGDTSPEQGNFFTRLFRRSTRGKKKKHIEVKQRSKSEEKELLTPRTNDDDEQTESMFTLRAESEEPHITTSPVQISETPLLDTLQHDAEAQNVAQSDHIEEQWRTLDNKLSRSQEMILEHQEARHQFLMSKVITTTGTTVTMTNEEVTTESSTKESNEGRQESTTNISNLHGATQGRDVGSTEEIIFERSFTQQSTSSKAEHEFTNKLEDSYEIISGPETPIVNETDKSVGLEFEKLQLEAQEIRGEIVHSSQTDEFEIIKGSENEVSEEEKPHRKEISLLDDFCTSVNEVHDRQSSVAMSSGELETDKIGSTELFINEDITGSVLNEPFPQIESDVPSSAEVFTASSQSKRLNETLLEVAIPALPGEEKLDDNNVGITSDLITEVERKESEELAIDKIESDQKTDVYLVGSEAPIVHESVDVKVYSVTDLKEKQTEFPCDQFQSEELSNVNLVANLEQELKLDEVISDPVLPLSSDSDYFSSETSKMQEFALDTQKDQITKENLPVNSSVDSNVDINTNLEQELNLSDATSAPVLPLSSDTDDVSSETSKMQEFALDTQQDRITEEENLPVNSSVDINVDINTNLEQEINLNEVTSAPLHPLSSDTDDVSSETSKMQEFASDTQKDRITEENLPVNSPVDINVDINTNLEQEINLNEVTSAPMLPLSSDTDDVSSETSKMQKFAVDTQQDRITDIDMDVDDSTLKDTQDTNDDLVYVHQQEQHSQIGVALATSVAQEEAYDVSISDGILSKVSESSTDEIIQQAPLQSDYSVKPVHSDLPEQLVMDNVTRIDQSTNNSFDKIIESEMSPSDNLVIERKDTELSQHTCITETEENIAEVIRDDVRTELQDLSPAVDIKDQHVPSTGEERFNVDENDENTWEVIQEDNESMSAQIMPITPQFESETLAEVKQSQDLARRIQLKDEEHIEPASLNMDDFNEFSKKDEIDVDMDEVMRDKSPSSDMTLMAEKVVKEAYSEALTELETEHCGDGESIDDAKNISSVNTMEVPIYVDNDKDLFENSLDMQTASSLTPFDNAFEVSSMHTIPPETLVEQGMETKMSQNSPCDDSIAQEFLPCDSSDGLFQSPNEMETISGNDIVPSRTVDAFIEQELQSNILPEPLNELQSSQPTTEDIQPEICVHDVPEKSLEIQSHTKIECTDSMIQDEISSDLSMTSTSQIHSETATGIPVVTDTGSEKYICDETWPLDETYAGTQEFEKQPESDDIAIPDAGKAEQKLDIHEYEKSTVEDAFTSEVLGSSGNNMLNDESEGQGNISQEVTGVGIDIEMPGEPKSVDAAELDLNPSSEYIQSPQDDDATKSDEQDFNRKDELLEGHMAMAEHPPSLEQVVLDSSCTTESLHSDQTDLSPKDQQAIEEHGDPSNEIAAYVVQEFVWEHGGEQVHVAGSFNDWVPVPMSGSGGLFKLTLELPAGRHYYRYIVDDQNMVNPIEDSEGELNVLEVKQQQ